MVSKQGWGVGPIELAAGFSKWVHLVSRLSRRIRSNLTSTDMNAYYIRHFLASLAFPEEAISRVRHKFVLTLSAGDVEGRFFPLQLPLQNWDGKEHCARDENHCSSKVESGIIVPQSVVKSS